MKALSIRQPWAWLIVNGYKDIENRDWSTKFGGRIYVHAGKQWDGNAMPFIRQLVGPMISAKVCTPWELPLGAIVGEVDVMRCLRLEDFRKKDRNNPWFTGPYGLVLANPVAYDKPIPYRGSLGFFTVSLVK